MFAVTTHTFKDCTLDFSFIIFSGGGENVHILQFKHNSNSWIVQWDF